MEVHVYNISNCSNCDPHVSKYRAGFSVYIYGVNIAKIALLMYNAARSAEPACRVHQYVYIAQHAWGCLRMRLEGQLIKSVSKKQNPLLVPYRMNSNFADFCLNNI